MGACIRIPVAPLWLHIACITIRCLFERGSPCRSGVQADKSDVSRGVRTKERMNQEGLPAGFFHDEAVTVVMVSPRY